MPVTDQQLRQELLNFGETVPPITQRNREQLRARLEILRTQSRSRVASSPPRTRATAASPSRSRAAASPSRPLLPSSPSRSRAAASPSRSAVTSSPSRTRASATTTTTTTTTSGSRAGIRSKPVPGLIELSDSETEITSADLLMSRSAGTGHLGPNVQTRSIALQRQNDSPGSLPSSSGISGSAKVTDDVEQSIARHRREIKQLLDTARDRNRPTNTSTSSHHSAQHDQNEPSRSPVRPSSPSSNSKARTHRQSSTSDNNKHNRSPKSEEDKSKKSSSLKRVAKPVQKFWKKYINLLKNIVKALIVGSFLLGGILFLVQKGDSLFSYPQAISCSIKNATKCEDMKPVIAAVRKQLQIRTGEVDCGFRQKSDVLVPRSEIERYLNEKGLKFNLGNQERWMALLTYISEKKINDILLWNKTNQPTNILDQVLKLSTAEAIHSLTCRARQGVSKTIRNLCLLLLGSTGLLTLAWYLQRQSKQHEENEQTYKGFLGKVTGLLQDQYEKHLQNPHTQPWLAINHIRDRLIPEADRDRLKNIWDRVKNQMSTKDSGIRSESQLTEGKASDVWQWIKPGSSSPKKKQTESPKKSIEESYVYTSADLGLTECLKLRNFFGPDNCADDEEIDLVVDSIQNRCANIKRIEHIGIHSVFVYLKFSSKEAAGQGYHLLNNWTYHGREINVKYVRLNRYYEHFPEAQESNTNY